MARTIILQTVSCTLPVCVPPRIDHFGNPSPLHSDVLLRVDPYLQRLPHAWLLNCLHLTPSVFSSFRLRCQCFSDHAVPTTLQDSAERSSAQFQNFRSLGLEIYILGICDNPFRTDVFQRLIHQYRDYHIHITHLHRAFKRLHANNKVHILNDANASRNWDHLLYVYCTALGVFRHIDNGLSVLR